MLEKYIHERKKQKDILLMTHIVVGYPSLDSCYEIVKTMVAAGVDVMELQIPFSEPIADGPVILKANQEALATGVSVKACIEFGGRVAREFDIPFLFMTYYNILYQYGVEKFARTTASNGLKGAIVPDLPPEEAQTYLAAMGENNLAPIFIYAPTTPDARMQLLAGHTQGFIYCVARKGVTGQETRFSQELDGYLARCRQATSLPLALGFGVKDKDDIDFLTGKVDIAVIGTQTIRVVEEQGIDAVGDFIRGLNNI
jgi:tryptophan synthase alpha chain